MSLNSPAVSELAVERTTLGLLQEWLAGWFDGLAHEVGVNEPVVFPLAEVRFQLGGLEQPLGERVGISVVWSHGGSKRLGWTQEGLYRQQEVWLTGTWNVFVRAGRSAETGETAEGRVTSASDLLVGILGNSHAALPLAEKGIHRLRPQAAVVMADAAYATRLVVCRGQVYWRVASQRV